MEAEVRRAALPHIAALDGARGAAVAGVLLFHGGHLRGGYLGVDFFFTLSGFLITSLLLAESQRTGRVSLGAFWARRARRLLPALTVLLLGVAVYCAVLAKPEQLTQIRGDALATLAYAANWREVFAHQSYWALFNAPSPLNHTWSLAIEEQFYVLWPLLFVALVARWKRDTPKAVFVVSSAMALISATLMVVLYDPANTARTYFATDTRAAAILFGAALAAWLAMKGPTKDRLALEGLGLVGAIVLAVAWVRLDGQSATLYRGGFLVCGLGATAVIAAAVHPESRVLSRALSFRPLCGLGIISYGVYLYHWPIDLVLDTTRVHLHGWPLFAVQTSVTLVLAIVSYRVIEQPIRRGALSRQQWSKLVPVVAFGLVLAIVVSTAGAHPVLTQSNPLGRHVVADAALASRDAAPGARRVLVVGNSVAVSLAEPMKHLHTNPPLAVFDAGVIRCNPLSATRIRTRDPAGTATITPGLPCAGAWEAGVVKRFRPDLVFWVVSGPPSDVWLDNQWVRPCSARYATRFRHDVGREIALLGSRGAKVVMTTAAYTRSIFLAGLDRPTDCENRLRREVAASAGVQLVDLFDYICPRGRCRGEQDGVPLRPDGLHYGSAGGPIVARWLIDQVAPR